MSRNAATVLGPQMKAHSCVIGPGRMAGARLLGTTPSF